MSQNGETNGQALVPWVEEGSSLCSVKSMGHPLMCLGG